MSTMHWTIEMRTNFTDRDKDEVAKKNVLKAARQLNALMLLIQDEIAPQIVVTGNDWLASPKELDLFADLEDGALEAAQQPDEISSDLFNALHEMKGDRT